MIVQQQEITKNNNHLFDHLTSISTRPIKQDYYNFDPDLPTNLNYPYRKE